MQRWINLEQYYIALGDQRLNARFGQLVERLTEQPSVSIPQACRSWSDAKAAYRFLDNPKVDPDRIRQALYGATIERSAAFPELLVVQDTTELDYSTHAAMRQMGYLEQAGQLGCKMHSALVVTPQSVPLGVIDQLVWAREDPSAFGIHQQRKQRPLWAKESYRWLQTQEHVAERLCARLASGADRHVVMIGDRENDLYAFWAQPRPPGMDYLIRAAYNRTTATPPSSTHGQCHSGAAKCLREQVLAFPVAEERPMVLPRGSRRKERTVQVAIRFGTVEILRPQRVRHAPAAIGLNAVLVSEAASSAARARAANERPIDWLLLTTLPVDSLADARRCIEWYSRRWLIERYHYTLKSGCQVEDLQLEERVRIERALAVYCTVAWVLLHLTYLARTVPAEMPCTVFFEETEWKALLRCFHRHPIGPNTEPPTLHEAIGMIAQLGGFLARKGDGPPGVKVLWRGMRRLFDFLLAYDIFTQDVGKG